LKSVYVAAGNLVLGLNLLPRSPISGCAFK